MTQHTQLWVVRHPQTDWNQAHRYQSHTDRPLTALGQAQTTAIAHRLRRFAFDTIISLGMTRTEAVVAAVDAHQRRAPQVIHAPSWREADQGQWEGLTYAEVARSYSEEARARFADPVHSRAHGGESIADVGSRMALAWEALRAAHRGGRVLLVSEATPIQLLLCRLLELPVAQYWHFRIDLGGLTCVDLYPSGAILRVVNDVPRWRGTG
jgi:2,3-bisphosphoglycerate-dependent phosphoglycerate mutase/probable phosphoglycerate mutase